VISWLNQWDVRALAGLDVWEFSARSLLHPYGRFFLRRMVLQHPWRAWKGFRVYAQTVRPARQPALAPVLVKNEDDFCERAATGPWLLALGFCEKPTDPPCPAGRFNHDCLWLRQDFQAAHSTPLPCQHCRFRELAQHALSAGASLHLMTSAHDIARDILLPGLRHPPWKCLLLCVCPFSVPPISLAMTLCQLPGLVLDYNAGDCQNYHAWLQADNGVKPERTFLTPAAHQRMIAWMNSIAAIRKARGIPQSVCYHLHDHFFHPTPSGNSPPSSPS